MSHRTGDEQHSEHMTTSLVKEAVCAKHIETLKGPDMSQQALTAGQARLRRIQQVHCHWWDSNPQCERSRT